MKGRSTMRSAMRMFCGGIGLLLAAGTLPAQVVYQQPVNWPEPTTWEEGFDLTEADEHYGEVNPYGEPRR